MQNGELIFIEKITALTSQFRVIILCMFVVVILAVRCRSKVSMFAIAVALESPTCGEAARTVRALVGWFLGHRDGLRNEIIT
jgi:hypothetical protein